MSKSWFYGLAVLWVLGMVVTGLVAYRAGSRPIPPKPIPVYNTIYRNFKSPKPVPAQT